MKKSKKKNNKKRHKNQVDYIDINNLLGTLVDLDTNVYFKENFGICPLELIHLMLKYPNSKL